uniref:Retrotransposon protein n=1 Tax=Steinernema glaseri TaxID=37863 RepID=A0A1I7ZNU6_9BILA
MIHEPPFGRAEGVTQTSDGLAGRDAANKEERKWKTCVLKTSTNMKDQIKLNMSSDGGVELNWMEDHFEEARTVRSVRRTNFFELPEF